MNNKQIAHKLIELAYELDPDTKLKPVSSTIKIPAKLKSIVAKWQKKGFTGITQFDGPQDVKDVIGLAIYENEPYIWNNPLDSKADKRPKKYLLLYTPEVPQETKGLSATEADKLFKKNNWKGMTLYEYLVIQRDEFKARGNHSFDAYNWEDASKSNWSWLLGSRSSGEVVCASWDPWYSQVDLRSGSVSSSYPGLGARPVVVIPL